MTDPTPDASRTTRRRFLKTSAAALLAPMAAPFIVPSSVLGRGLRLAPSERLTIGSIGVGNMGSGHLNSMIRHREVQVVAIADVRETRRLEKAKQVDDHYGQGAGRANYHACATYNEYERILERDDIDAVLIAVPDHWHATIAIAACQAGKDVYCEKPLSLTIREAEQMVAAARRYGRVFQTGSQQRSSSNFRFACELVRSGRIGKLQSVNVGIGLPSEYRVMPTETIPAGMDWDRWLGPAPYSEYNSERCSGNYSGGWRLLRDYSGGMTTDWGAHHYDIAQWGMGMDGHGPIEITADKPGSPTTFRYENGVVMRRGDANGVLFTGTEGKVEVNRGYLKTWPSSLEHETLGSGDTHLYRSPGHFQDWLNCVRTRRRPIADVAIGASSVTVCHLANIAHWLGRTIQWDPAKREIIGDAIAARMLDRPKRAPYRLHRRGALS